MEGTRRYAKYTQAGGNLELCNSEPALLNFTVRIPMQNLYLYTYI